MPAAFHASLFYLMKIFGCQVSPAGGGAGGGRWQAGSLFTVFNYICEKLKMKYHHYILLLTLIILSSCKGVEDITFTGVDNVVLQGIENNKVKFSADISIYNPSSVNFKISEVNLKTIVDGNFLGTLSTANPVKIKAKSDSSYNAEFSLDLVNLMSGASTFYNVSRKKQVNIEMQGFIKARSFLASRKIDISEKRLIDVPEFNR